MSEPNNYMKTESKLSVKTIFILKPRERMNHLLPTRRYCIYQKENDYMIILYNNIHMNNWISILFYICNCVSYNCTYYDTLF